MASSTFSDIPAPACERGPLNNTLIIIVNNDGTLTVDQETLHKLLAEQESTSTNAVRLIRLGVAPTDCRSPVSSDGEDAAGSGHVNITVEGYYPPGHGYRLAPDEPLEPVIADEMNRLGQVNAMLDMLSADDAFSIHDSIKMDHCYTNRLPCSDPNYTPPRPKAPEGRSFFTPLKKPVVPRVTAVSPAGKVMLVHPVKRPIPRVGAKTPATGSLLKPMDRPTPPPPVGLTEEMLNEKMMQFQRGDDDYNDLSGDDKSNSSAEQSVDVEDFAQAAGAPASAGGKTAPRPQKAVVYKGPNQKGARRADADETFVSEAHRTPKMHAHKLGAAGLKVYGKAKPAEVRKEVTPPSVDDSKKNYPRRENRKPPAHLLESFAGPALFSVPDVPRRVSMDAKGAKSFDAADFDFGSACETPETPETPEPSADGQSRLTSTLLDQLDASARRNSGEKTQRQSVDTVSSDSLGEMEMVTEDDPNKLWCICQRPHNNRFMICCDVCGEWFHGKCVGITKAIGQTMEEHGNEWTCPNCKKMGDAPGTSRRQSKITTFMRKPKPTEPAPAPVEESPVAATSCVVCKKTARDGTVYCSDDCLQKHAHETAMTEVHLAQPSVPQPLTPTPNLVAAPAIADVSPPIADKSQAKKTAPVTCGVKTSRPGSLKTWLKPNPALVKSMPPPTATSSPIKPKQMVLIDAKPMPPTVPQKLAKAGSVSETHKDVAAEKTAVLIVPKLVLSPIKEKSMAKHDGKRVSRVEVKVPEAVKKEETEPIRVNVRKTLHEQLLARTTECEDLKGIADEKVQRIALHIEEELFTYFNKDAGCKYKSKYRSLIFNIKDPKNLTLFRKIVDKSISAHQLVRLSAEEFASQELTQWREQETKHQLEMIKKNEMELLALSKTYVMKTHKGEQVIESEDGVKSDAGKIADMDIDSVTSTDTKLKSKDKKTKMKSKSKKSKSHKSSRDKKKHHSKSSKHHKNSHESSSSSSTQKKLDDYVRVVDRREDLNVSKDSDLDNGYTGKDLDDSKPAPVMDASSVQEIIFGKVSEDQDMEVDESGSHDESITTPEHSSVDDKEAASTVWRGVAEMPDVAKFQTTIQAVSGDSEKHCQTLPDRINIVGRISPSIVWEHVSKMKKTETHEILVVRLTAKNENEKIAYVTLYSYLNTRNRLGVVGRKGVIAPVSQTIKDFYILPLSNHSPIPQALLPLQGPGLEEDRPHLLLGILIARSGRKRPAPVVSYVTKAPRLADSADTARVFTPPLPDDEDAPSLPKPPSPSRDSRPCTPETEGHSTPEENSETEAETIQKVTSLLDEDAPYSPKDDDEDEPVVKLTEAEESSLALQRKMDELNRKIAEQKLEIESISSGLGSDSLIPGLGSLPSFMGTEFPTSKDADEAYSPSESITPPLKEVIPFISTGSRAPADVIAPDISLPSNLHEILANIKKHAAVEPKMDLKHDPIVQSYSARMDEEKEKIAAKKEQFSAVYIPSSIKKSAEFGASKSDEPHETLAKDSVGGKASSVVAKPSSQLQMQAASGDPRKRPAAEPPKPKSTLSKLTDAELIEKAAAMELEMAATPSPVPTVVKKAPIKFSIPSQFGRAQGVGCLPEAPPPLPPPPPPPPPEAPSTQSKRLVGLNSLASMPCNPPPPSDYHIPFTNPPAPMLSVNPPPPPPLPGMIQSLPFPSRTPLPGRIPLPPLSGMHPLPPAPGMNPLPPVTGMNPLPPLPGRSPLPPLPGMNPLPPLPGMNPPAPSNHSLYSHHPPPYRRGKYDRNH